MNNIKKNFLIFLTTLFLILPNASLKAEEEDVLLQSVIDQIQVLTKDIKSQRIF